MKNTNFFQMRKRMDLIITGVKDSVAAELEAKKGFLVRTGRVKRRNEITKEMLNKVKCQRLPYGRVRAYTCSIMR